MLFWACCAVQVLLLSLSKTGWRTDLTKELSIFFSNQFFFFLPGSAPWWSSPHTCLCWEQSWGLALTMAELPILWGQLIPDNPASPAQDSVPYPAGFGGNQ